MNSLANIVKGLLNLHKKIDVKILPSQGLFYKDDFEIHIKRADTEDIIEYEYKYDIEDIGLVLTRLKKIVEKNTIFSYGYCFEDIKSVDIIFIFFEIVKFTNNKSVDIPYFNDSLGKEDIIPFGPSTFNYHRISDSVMKYYDKISKEFNIDGYRYSPPSSGVENSVTQFLISKSYDENSSFYNSLSYDFLYFLGNKTRVTFSEIENLIQIFNNDLPEVERNKVREIVVQFSSLGKYCLKNDSQIVDITQKINLEKIWK